MSYSENFLKHIINTFGMMDSSGLNIFKSLIHSTFLFLNRFSDAHAFKRIKNFSQMRKY